ncbi:collagen-binding domain-containing protein [Haladaptatus sp. QDMS2]|uniref:DUF7289 family protein n=2 Tax=unclassified Haladaptatus TaxID=2622732 RepID=UPI0023E790B3|nr:collagen-binding domain-containing protein [Haladaptatus sp. QDMS2]
MVRINVLGGGLSLAAIASRITKYVPTSVRIDFDDRAISPIIGIVLVFGMTIAGSAAVLYVGSPALENMQGEADVSKVEIGMVQIASRVETVGMSDERMSVALAQSKGQYYVDETAGHITIRHLDYDGEGGDADIYTSDLGAIIYVTDETEIAYQGGGVWRFDKSGSSMMISAPDIGYQYQTLKSDSGSEEDEYTLIVPVTKIEGTAAVSGATTAAVTKTTRSQAIYPNKMAVYPNGQEFRNPAFNGTLEIEIQSEYYEAWGRYLSAELGQSAEYNHDTKTVRVSLTPYDRTAVAVGGSDPRINVITAALYSDTMSQTTHLNSQSTIDSYDSRVGDYDSSNMTSGADVVIGGPLKLNNPAGVYGNVTAAVVENNNPGDITGAIDTEFTSGLPTLEPIDAMIVGHITRIQEDNDNDNASSITVYANDIELDCTNDCELSAGSYYVNQTVKVKKTMTLDTTKGDIELAIDDGMKFEADKGTIQIIGDGKVFIYMAGGDIGIKQSTVEIPNDNAIQFWMFNLDSAAVTFEGGSEFTGIVYAPGATIIIKSDTHVYGAVVGYLADLQSNAGIHFDRALLGGTAYKAPTYEWDYVKPNTTLPPVKFLLGTERTVTVELE